VRGRADVSGDRTGNRHPPWNSKGAIPETAAGVTPPALCVLLRPAGES